MPGNPKDEGRSGGNPKDEGRSGGNPKDEGRGGGSGAFGAGGGWVAVTFLSPIGVNVLDFAIGMLQGGQGGPVPKDTLLAQAAVDAQITARAQRQERDAQRALAKMITDQYPQSRITGQLKKLGLGGE